MVSINRDATFQGFNITNTAEKLSSAAASNCRVQPGCAAPIPLRGLLRFDVAVGHRDVAAALMARLRAGPIAIVARHASCARDVILRIVNNPRAGLFGGLRSDAAIWIGRVQRLAAAVGDLNGRRGVAHLVIEERREVAHVPNVRPIAAAEPEIEAVVGHGQFARLRGINGEQFIKFFRARRTKKQVGCLLVRLQQIKPCAAQNVTMISPRENETGRDFECAGGGDFVWVRLGGIELWRTRAWEIARAYSRL